MHELTGRRVGLKVLVSQGANLDITVANGRLVLGIFAAPVEFKRELTVERIMEAWYPCVPAAATAAGRSR